MMMTFTSKAQTHLYCPRRYETSLLTAIMESRLYV
jgi:hypothetical protein